LSKEVLYGLAVPINSYFILSREDPDLPITKLQMISSRTQRRMELTYDRKLGIRRLMVMKEDLFVDYNRDSQGYGEPPKPLKAWQPKLAEYQYVDAAIKSLSCLLGERVFNFGIDSIHAKMFHERYIRDGVFPRSSLHAAIKIVRDGLKRDLEKYPELENRIPFIKYSALVCESNPLDIDDLLPIKRPYMYILISSKRGFDIWDYDLKK